MKILEPEELKSTFNFAKNYSGKDIKWKVLRQPRRARRAFWTSFVNHIITTAESDWYLYFIEEELGRIHDYYFKYRTETFEAVTFLGNDICAMELMIRISVRY